jgi:hypothetical protein
LITFQSPILTDDQSELENRRKLEGWVRLPMVPVTFSGGEVSFRFQYVSVSFRALFPQVSLVISSVCVPQFRAGEPKKQVSEPFPCAVCWLRGCSPLNGKTNR